MSYAVPLFPRKNSPNAITASEASNANAQAAPENVYTRDSRSSTSRSERPDRAIIKDEWIQYVIQNPLREERQEDGRIRRWAHIVA